MILSVESMKEMENLLRCFSIRKPDKILRTRMVKIMKNELEQIMFQTKKEEERIDRQIAMVRSLIEKVEFNDPDISENRSNGRSTTTYSPMHRTNIYLIGLPLVLILLIVGAELFNMNLQQNRATNLPLVDDKAVAIMGEMINPVWKNDSSEYQTGQSVASDRIALESGMLRLHFLNGAEMILTGPSELLVSPKNDLFSGKGRFSVLVPQNAKGLTINTPFGTVIDRGTEFAVNISEDSLDVAVITGQVEVGNAKSSFRNFSQGFGARIGRFGEIESVKAQKDQYISPRVYDEKILVHTSQILQKKQKRDELLDHTPDLVARFDFNRAENGRIPNSAINGKDYLSDAVISNCQQINGRFRTLNATRFHSRSDLAVFQNDIPFESITLFARIRIRQLPNEGNVLLSSNDFLKKPGTPVWQITRSGIVQLQITQNAHSDPGCFNSDPVISQKSFGTWITLAVTADAKNKTITHYCNGKKITTIPWKKPLPLILSEGTIGNLTQLKTANNGRFFFGDFEEFQIWQRALTEQEIQNMCE